ncbi:MAG: hypothetical protein M1840_008586 [Geoglossum simile]|nr:MAG: hypothetical protein M1840_008586 [Geoglossum simile]
MAAVSTFKPSAIAGLHVAPTISDLEDSSNAYNQLPDDGDQPPVQQCHLQKLANIFMRYNVQSKFGLHLIHGHLKIKEGTVMLGTSFTEPSGYLTRPTSIQDINPEGIHGHIFMLFPGQRLVAYEYREGPPNDIAGTNSAFFEELIEYLHNHALASVLGLQVLYEGQSKQMVEFVLKDVGTVMLDVSEAKYGTISRVTGWVVSGEGGLVEFKGAEAHAKTTKDTHQVFINGKVLSDLAELKLLLKDEGII